MDYIPKFDEDQKELKNFLRSCNLARKLISTELESQLTRLVATRISGTAAEAMGEKVFYNIKEVINFSSSCLVV